MGGSYLIDKLMAKKKIKEESGRNTIATLVAAAAVVIVIGAIAGYAIYRQQIEPFETVVLRINDHTVKMRYFLKRLKMNETNPSFGGATSVLNQLSIEEVIRQSATKAPFNIEATEEDIDQFLREVAKRGSESITEEEYEEWYRQQLNQAQLTDEEFRDIAKIGIYRRELTEYLAERAPTVAEQVHLHMIAQQSVEEISKVKQRLDKGEDFFQLAGEINLSVEARENQGDLGWHPKNSLNQMLSHQAFQLEVNQPSDPIRLSEQLFGIILVSEKAAARELSEQALQIQKASLVDAWAAKEFKYYKITFHGFNNGWDSETDAWARWQLMRMNPRDEEEK